MASHLIMFLLGFLVADMLRNFIENIRARREFREAVRRQEEAKSPEQELAEFMQAVQESMGKETGHGGSQER